MATTSEVIEEELEVWGIELFEALRQTLKDKKVEHGGGQGPELLFENNMNIILNFGGNEYSWVVNMQEYWKYLEYGTKPGGWMPTEKMKNWITLKGINPSSVLHQMRLKSLQANGKKISGKIKPLPFAKALPQLAYVLQKSIYKKGISAWQQKHFGKKSTNFVRETLDRMVPILTERLQAKAGQAIIAVIKDEIENK